MPLIVVYYERWSGRLAYRLALNASVQTTPDIPDKPTLRHVTARPYLFKGFRRVPQLGWAEAGDQRVVDAGPALAQPLHPFLFQGFRRQAWLGFSEARDVPIIAVAGAVPQFLHAYLLHGFPRQPSLGWSVPSDVTPPTPPAGPEFTITVRRLRLLHQDQQR